jgi:hypothetical protein
MEFDSHCVGVGRIVVTCCSPPPYLRTAYPIGEHGEPNGVVVVREFEENSAPKRMVQQVVRVVRSGLSFSEWS